MGAKIEILHRDGHLAVVAKPAGVLSVGSAGGRGLALPELLADAGLQVHPAHRLDRDVSGALLVAFDAKTCEALQDLFRERVVRKRYWALVRGRLARAEGEIKDPILQERDRARVSARGKPACTRYRTLRAFDDVTEVEVDLVTGRYNQIRVHFAHRGHALVGERKYARGKEDPLRAGRLALHSARIAFDHPVTGERVDVEAPLPPELAELLRRAGG